MRSLRTIKYATPTFVKGLSILARPRKNLSRIVAAIRLKSLFYPTFLQSRRTLIIAQSTGGQLNLQSKEIFEISCLGINVSCNIRSCEPPVVWPIYRSIGFESPLSLDVLNI